MQLALSRFTFLLLALLLVLPSPSAAICRAPSAASERPPATEGTAGGVSAAERQALLDLFSSTGGSQWFQSSGWGGIAGSECQWFGVQCTFCGQADCVADLCLDHNNLHGPIPGTIRDLDWLSTLDMRGNGINGLIPVSDLADMPLLRSVLLGDNQLSGEIQEGLGSIYDLGQLDLGNNLLRGPIPGDFGQFMNLWSLDLRGNRLRGLIPESIGNVYSLQEIYLQHNALYPATSALAQFISDRDPLGNWLSTQTLSPVGLTSAAAGTDAIRLSWTTISYSADSGGYRIYQAETESGPFSLVGETADKRVAEATVTELEAETTYYFLLKTVTYPHSSNQNVVLSDESSIVRQTTESSRGQIHLSAASTEATERGPITITVSRSLGSNGEVGVSYISTPGTAADGLDYQGVSGALSWNDGEEGSKTFEIEIVDDDEIEPVETFELTLLDPTGDVVIASPGQTVVSILDNDFHIESLSPASETGTNPTITVDRLGDQTLAWEEAGLTESNGGTGIYLRGYRANGQPKQEPARVDPGTDLETRSPAVGVDAGGNAVVLWNRRSGAGGSGVHATAGDEWGIAAVLVDPRGQPQGDPITVADGLSEGVIPSIDTEPNGSFVATWSRNQQAQGRRYNPNGQPSGPTFTPSRPDDTVVGPPVAANADFGQTFITWQGTSGSTELLEGIANPGIYAVLVNEDGEPEGEPFSIETDGDEVVVSRPDVAATPDGNYVVVWQSQNSGNSSRIRGRRYGSQGTPLGDAFTISQIEGNHRRPKVAVNAGGDFAVVWQGETSGTSGVFGRYYSGDSSPGGTDFQIAGPADGTEAIDPDVTMADNDRIDVVFNRVRGDSTSAGVHRAAIFPPAAAGECAADATHLCLNQDRFRVSAAWRDFAGGTGVGQAIALTDDTGYFWFFRQENIELILKVLDGRVLTDHYWVFYGALSNVEYTITVTDTVTGITRTYFNGPGQFGSLGDTTALPSEALANLTEMALETWVEAPAGEPMWMNLRELPIDREVGSQATCSPDATHLCLNSSRFRIEADWRAPDGRTGSGQAVPLTSDTGYFWFFNSQNVELMVKVLDGRALTGSWWVFYGSLSNVQYEIRVTDTLTGNTVTYQNPQGHFGSVGDTHALPGD